jgi:hypothetical protein
MLIRYTTDDGKSQIQLRAKDQTVWLTQRDMAQLEKSSVTEEFAVTAAGGLKHRCSEPVHRPTNGLRTANSAVRQLPRNPR